MTRITDFGGVSAGYPLPDARQREQRAAAREDAADRAEITSPTPAAQTDIQQRIAQIRARIADGTYITPDKLDCVVTRLLAECTRE